MLAALSDSQNPFSFLLVILTGSIDTKITSTASYKKCVYKTRLFDGQKCIQFFNESAHLPLIAFLTIWPFLYFFPVFDLRFSPWSHPFVISFIWIWIKIHVGSIWSCDDVQCAVQLRNPQTMSRKNLGAACISQQCHVMMMIIDNSEYNYHEWLVSPIYYNIR